MMNEKEADCCHKKFNHSSGCSFSMFSVYSATAGRYRLLKPWKMMEPTVLSTPVYDSNAFANLYKILDLCKANGLEVIMGLNYLGQGWEPSGITFNTWITDPVQYNAFEAYVKEFLTRISAYSNMVYILFFTEDSQGTLKYWRTEDAKILCARFQPTLGSLPKRLPPNLRLAFRIGYHDNLLINMNSAAGHSPIQSLISFDFLSGVGYVDNRASNSSITNYLATRLSHFTAFYPNTPLTMLGCGASMNPPSGTSGQARVVDYILSYLISKGIGLSLWGWKGFSDNLEQSNANRGGALQT